jgi:hypothetical protein
MKAPEHSDPSDEDSSPKEELGANTPPEGRSPEKVPVSSKELLDYYKFALRSERADVAEIKLGEAFRSMGSEHIGLLHEIPKRGFDKVEKTDSPQMFYTKVSDKPDADGNYEALFMLRMNDGGSSEDAVVCANIKVNSEGKRVENSISGSMILSEWEYNVAVKGHPKSLNAKWMKGELTTEQYKKKYGGFLGMRGSLDDYWEKKDEELKGDRGRWQAIAEAEQTDFLERLKGNYIEKLQERNDQVKEIIKDTEEKVEKTSVASILTAAKLINLYIENSGSIDESEIKRFSEVFKLSKEDLDEIIENARMEYKKRKGNQAHTAHQGQRQSAGGNSSGNRRR